MEKPSYSPKKSEMYTLVQSQKWQNDLGLFPRQIIQHHSNPSLCSNEYWRSWSWTVIWRPTRPSRANHPPHPQKSPFPHRGSKCKSRNSRETCSNMQVVPRSTKWSRAKANSFVKRPSSNNTKEQSTHEHHLMINSKILKRWKYQTTLPASWKTCMHDKKQKLELDTEQSTGSKLGKK